MPMKKTYHSVNGQIIYEAAPGAASPNNILTYGRDVLGSVVAGYDANANTVFTARYKPYGEFAATSGSVAGRRFMWAGSHGYRFSSGVPVSHYMIARHYSMRMGMWSTRDPLWLVERAYIYVNSRVVSVVDPSGKQFQDPADHRRQMYNRMLQNSIRTLKKGRCCASLEGYEEANPNYYDRGYGDRCEWEQIRPGCDDVFRAVSKCKVSLETFCNVVDRAKCCEIANKFKVSAACLCGMLMSERSWADRDNILKQGSDYFGYRSNNSNTTFGCNQMSIGTALSIIRSAKKCPSAKALLSRMSPDPSALSSSQIGRLLYSDCKWSTELAALWLYLTTAPACNKGNIRPCSQFYSLWNGGDGSGSNLGPELRKKAECLEKALRMHSPC